ncbi:MULTISPECIES: HEAT repeat domain-containing protein [unclassified Streptomyces]|uniref:HEAT repeat domain-containing protein n=1 Tax=unclassified Streptomyces TaxID=2593676 RepID=UPI000DACDDD6|nr:MULTISPECIES: HEAT repeat domain-containing protein [unclassified Streptomyces]PZT75709.1 hypothetical protein DNK56_19925 [Streptomyces sp. AC1-42W]PZT80338.1 hypothetical protein DNK55_12760 [Streptomyces sp. AC1-42T]
MGGDGSVAARGLVEGHSGLSADSRAAALRVFVPGEGDAPELTPFLLGVAADPGEEDLVRIAAIRLLEIVHRYDDGLAAVARDALIRLAGEDEDWDVRNAAGCAVFSLPGAEREVTRMRALIAAEEDDFVRENIEAALRLRSYRGQ